MNKELITVKDVLDMYYGKGYTPLLDKSKGDINIFGIRTKNTNGKYSDIIGVLRRCEKPVTCTINDATHTRRYDSSAQISIDLFTGTTVPGIPNLLKPINPKGTAIIVPGYYKNVWSKGLHKGKYPALVQTGAFKIYRDNNKDSIWNDNGGTYISVGDGINLHHGSIAKSIFIGPYSAGCQVIQDTAKFENVFMYIIKDSIVKGTTKFDYALFEEKDIKL